MNRALLRIPRRAESGQVERLADTFVDSGIAAALETVDHQVLYGRRGTGKTHALRYLEAQVTGAGDVAVYLDLRTVGSPEGLFMAGSVPVVERAGRLLVDLLAQFHEAVLAAALDDDALLADSLFVQHLDALLAAISAVTITGEVATETEQETTAGHKDSLEGQLTVGPAPQVSLTGGGETTSDRRQLVRRSHKGMAQRSLNFADIARALRTLGTSLASTRVWLLLDEWSAIPTDLQPYLAEFLTRCVLPLPRFTVKIATIEQQTSFRTSTTAGPPVGFELGADIAANLNLDDVMVYEQDPARSREFFAGLFHRHLTAAADAGPSLGLRTPEELVRVGFTDPRAFDELVMAAEGVPRDAINIAAKAAFRAGTQRISVANVRTAARAWFQEDKEAALAHREQAVGLLHWIIDQVIRERRARAFLVAQHDSHAPLLQALFDARVLHLYRRGYSGQDTPGTRYDVWIIDYGAYVDLISTRHAPLGLLPTGDDDTAGHAQVPTLDLRAIRRAILDLDTYTTAQADQTPKSPAGLMSLQP